MSIENPKYFSNNEGGGGDNKNTKEQPEQLAKEFLEKELEIDAEFFSKEISPEEFRAWQEKIQNDFINLPPEKQKILMDLLADKLGEVSKQIEEEEKKRTENKTEPNQEQKTKTEPAPEENKTKSKQEQKDKTDLNYKEEDYLKSLQSYKKAIINRLQAYHFVLGKENKQSQQEAEKIKAHFYDELKKVKDLPHETEIKKWRRMNECLRLLDDWLPFGHLDGFNGINELMNIIEESKSKIRISSPLIVENTARKIALEMAFQYQLWEEDEKTKVAKINSFIDTWLKNKSSYYQLGEEFKQYLSKPPEKYLQQRAEKGYVTGESTKEELNQEPDKISQWFINQIGENLKLLGQRDRTLSQVSKILAMQKIPYRETIDQLTSNIENTNVLFNTNVEIRNIEEMTDKEKNRLFLLNKAQFGIFPSLPLKIEFYEKLIEEKANNLKPEDKEIFLAILNQFETKIKDKKEKEKLEQLKNKIAGLVKQEKETPKPEAVKQAKEFIKEEQKKEEQKNKDSIFGKIGGWTTIGEFFGFSLIMFLILVLLGEFKLLDKATDLGGGGGKKK